MRLLCTALGALALVVARPALACPSCETALQTRAALAARGDFWSQLVILTLPLLLVAVLAIGLHHVGSTAASDESGSDPR